MAFLRVNVAFSQFEVEYKSNGTEEGRVDIYTKLEEAHRGSRSLAPETLLDVCDYNGFKMNVLVKLWEKEVWIKGKIYFI